MSLLRLLILFSHLLRFLWRLYKQYVPSIIIYFDLRNNADDNDDDDHDDDEDDDEFFLRNSRPSKRTFNISSYLLMFFKIIVLKSFAIFTNKTPVFESLFSSFIKKRFQHGCLLLILRNLLEHHFLQNTSSACFRFNRDLYQTFSP